MKRAAKSSTRWKWYGVRTLHRWVPSGRPKRLDSKFRPSATLLEDRIVTVRARSFDEALRKAESEARGYGGEPYHNRYGQIVRIRYLGVCDAFELLYPPGPGVEVFSAIHTVSRSVADNRLIDRFFGASHDVELSRRGEMFGNQDLMNEIRQPTAGSARHGSNDIPRTGRTHG